jgi:hypothetical protein
MVVWVWQVMVPCVVGDVAISEKPASQVSWYVVWGLLWFWGALFDAWCLTMCFNGGLWLDSGLWVLVIWMSVLESDEICPSTLDDSSEWCWCRMFVRWEVPDASVPCFLELW